MSTEDASGTENQFSKPAEQQIATAAFTTLSPSPELPNDYTDWIAKLKASITQTRLQVIIASNAAMVHLYWEIGQQILDRQSHSGWGAKVIDRIAYDLQQAFPQMKGFSSRNIKYMRAFASAWPNREIVQAVLAQIPWYHNIALLEKLNDSEERLWYAKQASQQGWSRNILVIQINHQSYQRQGKAQNNFQETLPATDSDLATQIFKDPYLFDFLGTDLPRREAELEQGLMAHMQKFLLELGQGFAFVGRQVHLELGGQDFYIDLLFYHLKLRCYIVLEIKARPFAVGDGEQLGLYMTAVDKLLKHPDDKPSIGLLLVSGKNEILVEYALGGMTKPMGVAEWETQLTQSLPANLQASLPTIAELEAELKKESQHK
jgi:predicted nuclease of restriction endonuclease-like (RecB) superfamily